MFQYHNCHVKVDSYEINIFYYCQLKKNSLSSLNKKAYIRKNIQYNYGDQT